MYHHQIFSRLAQTTHWENGSTQNELAETIDTLKLDRDDVGLVSLDVVSSFTNVPTEPTLQMLEPLFTSPVVKMFDYVLWST